MSWNYKGRSLGGAFCIGFVLKVGSLPVTYQAASQKCPRLVFTSQGFGIHRNHIIESVLSELVRFYSDHTLYFVTKYSVINSNSFFLNSEQSSLDIRVCEREENVERSSSESAAMSSLNVTKRHQSRQNNLENAFVQIRGCC